LVAALLAVLSAAAGAPAAEKPALELLQTLVLKGPAGRLDHLALDAKRQRLFVANMANSTLDIVDLHSGKLLKQIPEQKGIQGIAYAPDLDRIFVGTGEVGACNVFDGREYQLLRSIPLDDADNGRYQPLTQRVYVTHADKGLAVIDAKELKVLTDVKLPAPAEAFQLESGRPRLYLNTPQPSEVVVIDTDKDEILSRHPLKLSGKNYPMALDEANHRLYIGCRDKPMVVVLDSESGKEVASFAIPGDIDDLFWDAQRKRLYASCGEGFLAVAQKGEGDRYELLEKITTVKGARTSLFDTNSGRLYLVIPRQADKEGPEIRVYQAP
jgi:DNA-binding beta-propeller fold protein YncE